MLHFLAASVSSAILTYSSVLFNEYEVPMKLNNIQEVSYTQKDLNCLAKNIYFESRGEPIVGQIAVGFVTINRTESKEYPSDICKVVYEKNQFSWTADEGKIDEKIAWERAQAIASLVLNDALFDPTENATMFHADNISPYWKDAFKRTVEISNHIFYKDRT